MTELHWPKICMVVGLLLEAATLCAVIAAGEEPVIVNLKQGTIRALRIDLEDDKHYYVFKSIPYAKPPIGELRFKNPVPAGPWEGIRDGSTTTVPCPQIDFLSTIKGGSDLMGEEDCLFLDVYTPKPYAAGLPVMVWIHGGAFVQGDIEGYVPKPFMTKDVVVVNIQYRLGTLGFLSTGDSVIPGNRGLKDQVLALRWVQENIRDLGGDPDKVTIFGESAGGISVHYHVLSPMSKGLFKRAIAQSGTALLPGYHRYDHHEKAAAIGQMLECPGFDPNHLDSQVLYDCLKEVPKEKLVQLADAFKVFMGAPQVMVPSVDGEFLPEDPETMLREGNYQKVDFMIGVTKDEGGINVRALFLEPEKIATLAQNFSAVGPVLLSFDHEEENSKVYMAKRTFLHHIGSFNLTVDKTDAAAKMFSGHVFVIPMDISAQMHARDAPYGNSIFLYEFHHSGGHTLFDSPNFTFGRDWVVHAEEVQFLFEHKYTGKLEREADKFVSEMTATLWSNFAATGNPTPDMSLGFKWSPVTSPDDLQYLILKTSPKMRGFIRQEEMEFWTNLPTKQNKLLYPERFA